MRQERGLFPKTRAGVLAATLLDPDHQWYLSDLARKLGTTPSALQRELAHLTHMGVLGSHRDGNRVYFQANRDCPYFPELRGLIVKTSGVVDVLREALRPAAGRIGAAFVYGSFARAGEHAASDIDLLVVGSAGLAELVPLLRQAEGRLGRPVNAAVYTRHEFARGHAAGNHFLRSVMESDKLFILGDAGELAATG